MLKMLNSNKRGMTLNPKTKAGKKILPLHHASAPPPLFRNQTRPPGL